MRQGAASRSRHLLRRYHHLLQQVRARELTVVYVPDANNPSDFLTKWVSSKKLNDSLAYATGSRRRAIKRSEKS